MKQPFVLVIEDDVDVAKTLRYLLQREGFEVSVATRPERGVELAFDMLPDLVISDVTMDGVSGLEILRILKNDAATAHIPIILTSGREQLNCAGMFTFLMKPFDGKTLVTAARNALAGRRGARLAIA